MKIFLALADSPFKPVGGLGERWKNLLNYLEKDFNIYGICLGSGTDKVLGVGHLDDFFFMEFVLVANAEKQINKFGKPDLIIATDYFTVPTAYILSQQLEVPWIIEFNLALYSYQRLYNPNALHPSLIPYSNHINFLEKFASENADLVITCSEYYRNELPYKTKNWHKPEVIPNGLNLQDFNINAEKYKFQGNYKWNLVYIGRLNTQKGVRLLLDLDLPENTALNFIGSKEGSDLYQEVINVNPKSRKFYLGYKTGKEKIQIMKSANAILFPSLHEPFGIVGLEAIACKTPLITTLVGGISSYVSEKDCIKCEPTVVSIKNAIERLQKMSNEEISSMTERAYNNIKNFDWQQIAEKYKNIILSFKSN